MTLPGGRGGVMLAILAVWTLGIIAVLGLSFMSWMGKIADYEIAIAKYMERAEHDIVLANDMAAAYDGVLNPYDTMFTFFGFVGCCMWLPVTVALLIASVALWSRRT